MGSGVAVGRGLRSGAEGCRCRCGCREPGFERMRSAGMMV